MPSPYCIYSVPTNMKMSPRPAKLSAHLGDSQATGCCCGGKHGGLPLVRVLTKKFDKLLSVIVRRCEQHVYYKLTNKRTTDTLFIDNQ